MSIGPFWRYYGGKWRAAPKYPHPEHDLIIEPFAGAAGFACRYPQHDVLLIDANPRVASIWQWLISATPEDVLGIPTAPREILSAALPSPVSDLIGFWHQEGSTHPGRKPSKWATDKGQASGAWGGWGEKTRGRIAGWVDQISHWRVLCGDYTLCPDVEGTWFIDPPYQVHAGRKYPHQVGDRSNAAYAELRAWAHSRRGQVIACDGEGASWMEWTHRVQVKGAKNHRGAEVYWHRSSRQPSLFSRNA